MCAEDIIDVVIIGAGLSGLAAAYTLLEREPSLNISILEAKERIGGRILSIPMQVHGNQTCLFDIGAQWISSSQNHISALIKSFQLHPVCQNRTGLHIGILNGAIQTYSDHPMLGHFYAKYELKEFFALFEEKSTNFIFGNTENEFLTDFYDCLTMESYILSKLSTTAARKVAKNIVRITCGLEATQISVLYYLMLCNSTLGLSNQYMTYDSGAREFWLQETCFEICNQLNIRIGNTNVIYQEAVIDINYSNDEKLIIEVTSGQKYKCNYIICAIPPEQVLNIKFTPPLSKMRIHVLEQIQTGHANKFIITYKQFWKTRGYSGEIINCDNESIHMCYDITKNGFPTLTGYVNELSTVNDELLTHKDKIIEQLVKYWGSEAKYPIDYIEKLWRNEEFVGGCPMSCTGVHTMKWYHVIKHPAGRIYWAGAEIATEWNGYMNGAVQSGYRAAVHVLSQLRPQSLTYRDIIYVNSKRTHRIRLTTRKFLVLNKCTVPILLISGYLLYKAFK